MGRQVESRVVFERAHLAMDSILGSRHPRTSTVQGNVDKTKKSLGIKMQIKDIKESISIRPDADRLFTGNSYVINAHIPDKSKKSTKKSGSKGGKKKKK